MGRRDKARVRLASLEDEFHELLVASLRACAIERTPLFLTSTRAKRFGIPGLVRPEHHQLMELGREIETVRRQLGEPAFELFATFVRYCEMTGPNDLGDARRAELLLREIESI